MKTWKSAEVVELNISETAHGNVDFVIEASHNGWGTNNDLIDGGDKGDSVTPDTDSHS